MKKFTESTFCVKSRDNVTRESMDSESAYGFHRYLDWEERLVLPNAKQIKASLKRYLSGQTLLKVTVKKIKYASLYECMLTIRYEIGNKENEADASGRVCGYLNKIFAPYACTAYCR